MCCSRGRSHRAGAIVGRDAARSPSYGHIEHTQRVRCGMARAARMGGSARRLSGMLLEAAARARKIAAHRHCLRLLRPAWRSTLVYDLYGGRASATSPGGACKRGEGAPNAAPADPPATPSSLPPAAPRRAAPRLPTTSQSQTTRTSPSAAAPATAKASHEAPKGERAPRSGFTILRSSARREPAAAARSRASSRA